MLPKSYKKFVVRKIGSNIFHGCHNLESINLPDRLEHFGRGTFSDCPKLGSVTVGSIKKWTAGVDAVESKKELNAFVQFFCKVNVGGRRFLQREDGVSYGVALWPLIFSKLTQLLQKEHEREIEEAEAKKLNYRNDDDDDKEEEDFQDNATNRRKLNWSAIYYLLLNSGLCK